MKYWRQIISRKMDNYTWTYIENNPQETKRLLGINYKQLEELINYIKLLEKQQKEEKEKRKRN